MRFLLVVPRMVNHVGDFYQFPQGIAYISSVLSREGFLIHKLNLNHIDRPVNDAIRDAIQEYGIDVVLTGGLTGQYGGIRNVIESAKATNPNVVTIVGGGIITSAPLYAMKALEFADFGVIGEGEHIVCRLCSALQSGHSFKEIPGIVYKQGKNNYVISEGKPEPVDLDVIPFPDYEGLGLDELLKTVPNIIGMSESILFRSSQAGVVHINALFVFIHLGKNIEGVRSIMYLPRSTF